jgi:4-hydroxy-3-methylbut-2-enyl diphosphate reductase IspH
MRNKCSVRTSVTRGFRSLRSLRGVAATYRDRNSQMSGKLTQRFLIFKRATSQRQQRFHRSICEAQSKRQRDTPNTMPNAEPRLTCSALLVSDVACSNSARAFRHAGIPRPVAGSKTYKVLRGSSLQYRVNRAVELCSLTASIAATSADQPKDRREGDELRLSRVRPRHLY